MTPANDFIELASGRSMRPLAPEVGDILIMDIARGLSNQCRFSGQTQGHYSVAQHSVHVSELLQTWGCSQMIQLWGLMHDASEAYLVDIPMPLKHAAAFAPYRDAEARLMKVICHRFALPIAEPERVRVADGVLLATEARDLMPFRPEHWKGLKEAPLIEKIVPWTCVAAEHNFITRYARLVA